MSLARRPGHSWRSSVLCQVGPTRDPHAKCALRRSAESGGGSSLDQPVLAPQGGRCGLDQVFDPIVVLCRRALGEGPFIEPAGDAVPQIDLAEPGEPECRHAVFRSIPALEQSGQSGRENLLLFGPTDQVDREECRCAPGIANSSARRKLPGIYRSFSLGVGDSECSRSSVRIEPERPPTSCFTFIKPVQSKTELGDDVVGSGRLRFDPDRRGDKPLPTPHTASIP